MEIKRKLTALAKRLSPQIESMNVAHEMKQMITRFNELLNYAQEKIDRSEERKSAGFASIGEKAEARKARDQKVIADAQAAEAAENLKDQQQAFDERNAKGSNLNQPEETFEMGEDKDVLRNLSLSVDKRVDPVTHLDLAVETKPDPKAKKKDKKKK